MDMKKFHHVEKTWELTNLKTTTNNGSRYYVLDENLLPSVTTVTGHKKKAFFAEWRRKNPDESKRVLVRGNKLHSVIEDYINNKEIDISTIPANEAQLFMQLLPELNKIDNVYEQESPLWSLMLGLAGRVDCVAEYDGKLSIIDFKGSTRRKRPSDIKEYFMQATAYAIMWQERTGIPIHQVAILMSCEDGHTESFVDDPRSHVKNLKQMIEDYKREHPFG